MFDNDNFGLMLAAHSTKDYTVEFFAFNMPVPCACPGDQAASEDSLFYTHTFRPQNGSFFCKGDGCRGVDMHTWRHACAPRVHNGDRADGAHVVNFTAALMDTRDAFVEMMDDEQAQVDETRMRRENPLLVHDDFQVAPTVKLRGYGKRRAGIRDDAVSRKKVYVFDPLARSVASKHESPIHAFAPVSA